MLLAVAASASAQVTAPSTISVAPNSGSGLGLQIFTYLYSDASGYQSISDVQTILNNAPNLPASCATMYAPPNGNLYLAKDDGSGWMGPVTISQPGTLQNSQCTLNSGASSASGSGTNLTVNLAVSFQPTFTGLKNNFMLAEDTVNNLTSGFQDRGTWSVNAMVLTYHNDNARTGQYLNETILTPANVNASRFGKVGFFSVDGKVDAQPLYVSDVSIPGKGIHNVLYAATEHDSVYAFDAVTGAVLWQISLLGSAETTSDARNCYQVVPEIGITATPVIDPLHGPNGALYAIAMSKDGSGNYFQRLHALDLTSGAELFGGPTTIQASFPGTGDNSSGGNVIFDARQYKERPGLLLLNGQIYTTWSSHCDNQPYTSWVMSFDASTLAQTSVLNLTPNGSEGGIWMSGAGPAADAVGNIYFLEGNGTFDTTLDVNGFPDQGDYGNAFMKLSTNGSLRVADYFTMSNTVSESEGDIDLGSGGALVLPDLTDGSGNVHHLALGAGKDSIIYVVDRDQMGKFDPNTDPDYEEVTSLTSAVFSMPAYFSSTVYFGPVGDNIKAFSIANAQLLQNPTSQTANSFGYPGATPAVSANGNSNAILWAVENGSTAVLHAYDAMNLGTELYNSNQAASDRDQFGVDNKFITPIIANGRVYVGTTNGVAVFGLLPVTAGDYDGDGKTDVVIWRPSMGTWYVIPSSNPSSPIQQQWGTQDDIPVPGDYDGDGKTDFAVWRPSTGTWYIIPSSNPGSPIVKQWGTSGDIPVPGDYDGDGKTDFAVFRPSEGNWYIIPSGDSNTEIVQQWGTQGDVPVPGNYDGEGRTDIAVWRPSSGTWFVIPSNNVEMATQWGTQGDIPAPGDYDGDGKTDFAVWRPSTGTWFIIPSSNPGSPIQRQWGTEGDTPVPGDYDGDGKMDIVVWRPSSGTWFFNPATAIQWGIATDVAVQ